MSPERSDGLPRRFLLQRIQDHSGVSGTGHVADGVVWPDGTVALRWRGVHHSVAVYDCYADLEAIHGHNGSTHIVWIDGEDQP